jgi:hypothetical protein
MFFHDIFLHFFLFPRRVDSAIAGPEGTKNLAGRKVLCRSEIRMTASSLEKLRELVKKIRCKPESPIRVPEKPSAFHRHAQRNASRRDARQRSRLFPGWNQSLTRLLLVEADADFYWARCVKSQIVMSYGPA